MRVRLLTDRVVLADVRGITISLCQDCGTGIDVPEAEGQRLIEAGAALPVSPCRQIETAAVVPNAERRGKKRSKR